MKFKSEYFMTTEPVANRDVGMIQAGLIKTQLARLEKVEEQIGDVETKCSDQVKSLHSLKSKYEQFERQIFEAKHAHLQELSEETTSIESQIKEQEEKVTELISQCQGYAKEAMPFNKEQRQQLADHNQRTSKIQRLLQKACQTV